MKLHDKVVLYWLSRCCSVLLPPAEWSQDTYDYPLLLDPEGEQAGHVVIFSAADPVQDLSFRPDSFYICAGPCPTLPSTQPIRLAVIPKLTPMFTEAGAEIPFMMRSLIYDGKIPEDPYRSIGTEEYRCLCFI